MKIWVILTVIFGALAIIGVCAGKIREEDINDDKTVSGLLTSIGSIGFTVFGMFTMLCIFG